MRETLYDLISTNKIKTWIFMIIFSLLLGFIGYIIINIFNWGIGGYIMFALFIIFYNLITYYYSDKIALASVGARPADPYEFRALHNVVEEVAIAAGIPKPKVYVINDPSPNAFATGRNPNNASIAVTTGLLLLMDRSELQGVIAHEISHIRNYDILLMTIAAIMGGLIVLLRDFIFFFRPSRNDRNNSSGILVLIGILLAIISPILVALIRAAISRQREYLADASGAMIIRDPSALADALEKLLHFQRKMVNASAATAHLFIVNPFGEDRASFTGLFATHPPLEDRIRRLRNLII
ncbi:MAG: M48 family metalloprotease [bacterium]|nr:M48 family metalloprotease [bacterium]